MRGRRAVWWLRVFGAAAALAASALVLGAEGGSAGAWSPAASVTASEATAGASSFSTTKTVTRDEVVGGTDTVVASQTVGLTVSQTTGLQGRQEINVSWTGAHPTGAIVANQNSTRAQYEEFPVVLLECRGVDSTTVSPQDRLTPATCWTQAWTERYKGSFSDLYPAYRLDEYSPTRGDAIVGAPSPLPATCTRGTSQPVEYWVPWDAASGTVYPGGTGGCAGEPPEANNVGGSALPSNETFGVTGTGGTGSANFDVWTTDQNQTLGCSLTVPCALVAIPIMGISCDPEGLTPAPSTQQIAQCETTGTYSPGSSMTPSAIPGTTADISVTGSLWWSPSNWRNRITVPLSFGPSPDLCNVAKSASNNVVQVFGSELMIQATTQWEPKFCTSTTDAFTLTHVQTGEPEARNLLANNSIEAAFTSYGQSNGYPMPVVNAPVALTGFAVSYTIDGTDGKEYTSLKLTPLLLAKLLTESYPADTFVQSADPALANNPLNITQDPQFIALNPGIPKITASGALSEAASELVVMSGDSDVMQALTTYIEDDPAARAWLNGTPDAWGMVVNPAYKGIQLPVEQWPLLSSFEPTTYYNADTGQLNNCLATDPVPYLPLVAAPPETLEDISEALQFSQPNSTTHCTQPIEDSSVGEKLITAGRQQVGHRFEIGVTPLADSRRYLLPTAALQTTTDTYVVPTEASLKAAAALLTPDATTGTWPIPYGQFQQATGASAYPGTMVVYAAIPTSGLPAADAQDLATFLKYAVTTGQTPGTGVGQLPAGYVPLTATDGLAALRAYTLAAVTDIAAQNGRLPSLVLSSAKSTPTTGISQSSSSAATPTTTLTTVPYALAPTLSTPTMTATSSTASTGAPRTSSKARAPKLLRLDRTLDVALWTNGFPLGLTFGLALLGIVAALGALRIGRKRQRW